MKKLLAIVMVMAISLSLVACGSKDEVGEVAGETAQKTSQETSQETTTKKKASTEEIGSKVDMALGDKDALKERADQEGVSVKEIESMLGELTKLTAEKFGHTAEDYLMVMASEGKTPLDEFGTAADIMGISLGDYLSYERSSASNLTDAQKETMAGMADALAEASQLDIEGAMDDAAQAALEAMGGAAGDRQVTGHYRDMGLYEVKDVLEEDTTSEGSYGMYMVSYTSEAPTEEIMQYFRELLYGTPDYFGNIMPDFSVAQISGTANGDAMIFVVIDNDDQDAVTRIDYGYSGDFGMDVESSDSVETHLIGDSDDYEASFDLSLLDMTPIYPEGAVYTVVESQKVSDGSEEDIYTTYYATRSGENLQMEIESNANEAMGEGNVIYIYNADLDTSNMYMTGDPEAVLVTQADLSELKLFDLQAHIDGLGAYDSVVANDYYDESDYILDLYFVGDGFEVTIYYDKERHYITHVSKTEQYGNGTRFTESHLEYMDYSAQVDPKTFEVKGE